MEKTKYVRFDIYKAVIATKKDYDEKYTAISNKISSFDEANLKGWSTTKKKSFALWKQHKQQMDMEAQQVDTDWKLQDIIVAAVNGDIPNITMDYDGEKIEIDKNTFYTDQENNHILAFQITRLRADSLPAKKKIGLPRTNISLENDEYIGEFTEVIFDSDLSTVAIQSNKFGVGYSVVSRYLNYLWKIYTDIHGSQYPKYVIGKLEPIVDKTLTEKALQAKCIKKVWLRCSDENISAIIPENNTTLGEASRNIGKHTGIVFEVSLAVKDVKAAGPLPTSDFLTIGKNFVSMMNDPNTPASMKKDAKMEMTIITDDASSEAIDLLVPKVNFYVSIRVEDRVPIDAKYLNRIATVEYINRAGGIKLLLKGA